MTMNLLGYACGIAAGDEGCGDGPQCLQDSNLNEQLKLFRLNSQWCPLFKPLFKKDKYAVIAELSERLAKAVLSLSTKHQTFVTLGGDHTCAIGTWSGMAKAYQSKGDIGLIWVDAHLDSHTPETSESGNIHGMPLACLLGHGDSRLIHLLDSPSLKPQNVCIIGARSFESGEKQLLEKLNVRIFYMDEIKNRGFNHVFSEAIAIVSGNSVGYGLSIDLDAIDPNEAPGVGTPEKEGLIAEELLYCLNQLSYKDKKFLAAEIAEFNPHHDIQQKTQKLILELLVSIYGGKHESS